MLTFKGEDPRIAKIRYLYGRDAHIRALCDYLFLERPTLNRHDWSVENLEGPTDLDRGTLIDVFRKLEEIGLGTFVVGRRGYRSRFDWQVSPLSVGRIAWGKDSKLTPFTETEADSDEAGDQAPPPPELISHSFRLRPDFTLEFQLPLNLTSTEAARLADFIKTLPFNP